VKHLAGWFIAYPELADEMFLLIVGFLSTGYMALYHRRRNSSCFWTFIDIKYNVHKYFQNQIFYGQIVYHNENLIKSTVTTFVHEFQCIRVAKYYWNDQVRTRWSKHVTRMGEKRIAYRILSGKPECRRPLRRTRRRWNIILKMDLRQVDWDGRDRIHLALCREYVGFL
jgi:hypothetical protein